MWLGNLFILWIEVIRDFKFILWFFYNINIYGFMLMDSIFICMYLNLLFMCKINKKIIIYLFSWIWNISWNVEVN